MTDKLHEIFFQLTTNAFPNITMDVQRLN